MVGVILPAVLALISALVNLSASPLAPVGSYVMTDTQKFGIPTELSSWWPAASARLQPECHFSHSDLLCSQKTGSSKGVALRY